MQVTMNVSQVMSNMMVGVGRKLCEEVVEKCALKYGFSAEEALRELGIVLSVSAKKELKNEKKSKKVSPAFPLPFNGEHSDVLCQALRQNNGLYTQCQSSKKNGDFCKSCEQLASKSEDGIPEYGTISQRLASDVFNYTDPKGRKPTAYRKVMKKYKLTQEQVLEEACKFGIQINEAHFIAPEETKRGRPAAAPKEAKEPKGSKGRPKKSSKVVQIEDEDDDLFASLVASANQPLEDNNEDTKKAEKKQALEQEKAEKAAKLAAEKEAKEAAKKEAAKKTKKSPPPSSEQEETYKKCGEGKYIRSQQTNIVYDLAVYTETEELVPVGKWNADKKEIIFDNNDSVSELSDDEIDE